MSFGAGVVVPPALFALSASGVILSAFPAQKPLGECVADFMLKECFSAGFLGRFIFLILRDDWFSNISKTMRVLATKLEEYTENNSQARNQYWPAPQHDAAALGNPYPMENGGEQGGILDHLGNVAGGQPFAQGGLSSSVANQLAESKRILSPRSLVLSAILNFAVYLVDPQFGPGVASFVTGWELASIGLFVGFPTQKQIYFILFNSGRPHADCPQSSMTMYVYDGYCPYIILVVMLVMLRRRLSGQKRRMRRKPERRKEG